MTKVEKFALNVACPQRLLPSMSPTLNVACPQRRGLNVAALNVACPQCPIGIVTVEMNFISV